jgi:hypothetical protein
MEEVLRPIVEFRRCKVADSAAVREFYSLLRAAIKGAKGIGRLGLLVNDQTIPRIMGKMPYTNWKEWATRRPEWMQEDLGSAFEEFVERKWQDALNMAAAEPSPWGAERERTNPGKGTMIKTAPANRGVPKMSGAVNVIGQQSPPRLHSPSWDVSSGRKCRAWYLVGCDGDHVLLQCAKLLELSLSERKEVLKRSGLCLYCLKHAAEVECYGQGGFLKPRCMQTGCDGEHAVRVHKLLGESGASVNLVAEGEYELEEDEEWWVSTVRVEEEEEEEENMEEIDDSESEREAQYVTSTHMRKDDSGLEDELGYFWEVHNPSDPYEREEDRWWSPGPPEPSSEEDEEEVRYLTKVLGLGPEEDEARGEELSPPTGVEPGTTNSSQEPSRDEQGKGLPRAPNGAEPPCAKKTKRRKLRKKVTRNKDYQWELASQDAWLREMLTDSSGSKTEEKYARFAESGRWIAEMTGISQPTTTTSRGECSGQEKPGS